MAALLIRLCSVKEDLLRFTEHRRSTSDCSIRGYLYSGCNCCRGRYMVVQPEQGSASSLGEYLNICPGRQWKRNSNSGRKFEKSGRGICKRGPSRKEGKNVFGSGYWLRFLPNKFPAGKTGISDCDLYRNLKELIVGKIISLFIR